MNSLFKSSIFSVLITLTVACQPQFTPKVINEQGLLSGILDGYDLTVELAYTDAKRQRGLMFRDALDESHGMLFLFEYPDQRSFWMRNTRIPLDIAYFDANGVLREIHPLFPFDETPIQSSSRQIQFALEVNQGWFARNGILPGIQMNLHRLSLALLELSADPQHFNLPDSDR
jgi:uncharacterized membrane protein (UPF0127 family)